MAKSDRVKLPKTFDVFQCCSSTINMSADFNQSELPELLHPREVMKILRISQATFYRLVENREIPHFRIRSSVRLAKKDVLSYIAKQRIESADTWK